MFCRIQYVYKSFSSVLCFNLAYHASVIPKSPTNLHICMYSGVGTVAATAVLAAALLQSIKNFIKN